MSLGIDGILVTDNGSTDSTMEILKKYQEKGWIKEIIVNTSTTHPQAICVDKMIHIAKEKYHADWVINVDADEFWWTPLRNLKKAIGNYPHNNIIYVRFNNIFFIFNVKSHIHNWIINLFKRDKRRKYLCEQAFITM